MYQPLVRVLESHINIHNASADDPMVRLLIDGYLHVGARSKAMALAADIVTRTGPASKLSELATSLFEEAGDLTAARSTAEAYVAAFPDDFGMRLRLAGICYRTRDDAGVDAFLASSLPEGELTLQDSEAVLQLLAHRRQAQRAVRFGYRLRRRFNMEAAAHLRYQWLFLMGLSQQDTSFIVREVVVEDSVVTLRIAGDPDTTYLITREPEGSSAVIDLEPDNPLAKSLIGKRAGDTVVLNLDQPGQEEGVVVAVESKYVRALHETMHSFSRLFPENRQIQRFRLRLPEDPEAPPDLEPMETMLRQQRDRWQTVEQLYKENGLPIAFVAHAIGRNVFDVFKGFTEDEKHGVRCSFSSTDMVKATVSLETSPTLVADVIGLLTLHRIPHRDKIVAAMGGVSIVQPVLDHLIAHLREEETKPDDTERIIAGLAGNEITFRVISVDEIQRERMLLRDIVQWVEQVCTIVPSPSALDQSSGPSERIDEALGHGYRETYLAAMQPGSLLYSDDAAVRYLGANEFGCIGVWTQPLLMRARTLGAISDQEYHEAIIHLILHHFNDTYFDVGAVVEAARMANWRPASPFTEIAVAFGASFFSNANGPSALAWIIRELALKSLPDYSFQNLVIALLNATMGKDNSSRRAALAQLLRNINRALQVAPLHKDEAIAVIRAWFVSQSSLNLD